MKILILSLVVALISGCAEQEIPKFPPIELCKIVWVAEPYCRCTNIETNEKASYPKEECNLSLRPGGWATLMEYVKELESKLKKSYRKPFNEKLNAVKSAVEE